jgi:hypothetical protein
MSRARGLTVVFAIVAVGVLQADQKGANYSKNNFYANLEDGPLTFVFKKVIERSEEGVPHTWIWSVNYAGQCELTVPKFGQMKTNRRKFEVEANKMSALRIALREAKFFELNEFFGPAYIHGGWETLVVVAGDEAKTVRFNSSWSWPNGNSGMTSDSFPAIRVWLRVCEALDPDDRVFEHRRKVAELVGKVKK